MITGVDVSHWQGGIDWSTAKASVQFAILKCTEGTNYTDGYYLANKQGCVDNGIPHGAYHFFRDNQDPLAQAQHFFSAAGTNIKVYVCDTETCQGQSYQSSLKLFMQKLGELIGVRPLLYTSAGFWNYYGIHDPSWCQRYPLWVAHYHVQHPQIPTGFSTWVIWQYSDDGKVPGMTGDIDMDVFNGNVEELNALFGNGELPISLPNKVRVTASILNMCKLPGGTMVGYAPLGTIFGVTGQGFDMNGKRWWKVGNSYVASWFTEVVS